MQPLKKEITKGKKAKGRNLFQVLIIAYCSVPSRGGVGLTSDDRDSFPESLLNRVLNVCKWLGSLPSVEPWSIKLLCELDALSSALLPGKLSWLPVLRASSSMLVRVSSWSSTGSRDDLKVKYTCNHVNAITEKKIPTMKQIWILPAGKTKTVLNEESFSCLHQSLKGGYIIKLFQLVL